MMVDPGVCDLLKPPVLAVAAAAAAAAVFCMLAGLRWFSMLPGEGEGP